MLRCLLILFKAPQYAFLIDFFYVLVMDWVSKLIFTYLSEDSVTVLIDKSVAGDGVVGMEAVPLAGGVLQRRVPAARGARQQRPRGLVVELHVSVALALRHHTPWNISLFIPLVTIG